jgi:hypothetical protein
VLFFSAYSAFVVQLNTFDLVLYIASLQAFFRLVDLDVTCERHPRLANTFHLIASIQNQLKNICKLTTFLRDSAEVIMTHSLRKLDIIVRADTKDAALETRQHS